MVVLGRQQGGVAVLDRFGRLGVLGLAPRDHRRRAQAPLGALGDLGVVPQHLLVDPGQAADDLVVVGAGLEVGRGAAQEPAGRDRVEPGAGQQVDAAVGSSEHVADVDAPGDVDDAVLGPLGTEHGEGRAVVPGQLQVDARPTRSERADELADQAFPLDPADPGDHREAGVEVEGDRAAGSFEDEPVYPHLPSVGTRGCPLERDAVPRGCPRPRDR